MTTTDREYALEIFRDKVLSALDEAAREIFGNTSGATDADLPRLFKAVDAQVEALAKRYRVTLTSYSPDAIKKTGKQLAQSRDRRQQNAKHDNQARELFVKIATEAGCTVHENPNRK